MKVKSYNAKVETDGKKWLKLASMDYLSDFAVQLDYPGDKKEIEEIYVPMSKAWGKITEHFPARSSDKNEDEINLKGTSLPIGEQSFWSKRLLSNL